MAMTPGLISYYMHRAQGVLTKFKKVNKIQTIKKDKACMIRLILISQQEPSKSVLDGHHQAAESFLLAVG